jgi:hypothetical protein
MGDGKYWLRRFISNDQIERQRALRVASTAGKKLIRH